MNLQLPDFNKADFNNSSLIGQGSFGKVFRAEKNGKSYVIKELTDTTASSSDRRLLIKEAEMLKVVKGHENIVGIQGFSIADCAILMDFVSFSFTKLGIEHESVSTVKSFLSACDSISDFISFEHVPFFIAMDVCCGLEFLHDKNIVHRDLKPDNILISNQHYDGAAVQLWWATRPVKAILTDFGESRSTVLQTNSSLSTATGRLFRGSPIYMAPEALVSDGRTADIVTLKAMDIWSLGMVMFNLLNPGEAYPYKHEMDAAGDSVDRLSALR